MLSRIACTLALSRSARRVVSKQYVLKQCKHCCQPHTFLHTKHVLFKEEIQTDLKTTVSEGDPLVESKNDILTPIDLNKPTSEQNDTSQNTPIVPVEEQNTQVIPAVEEKSQAVPALADGNIIKYWMVPVPILLWLQDSYLKKSKRVYPSVSIETSQDGRITMSGQQNDVDDYIYNLKYFLRERCLLSSTVTKNDLLQSLCKSIRKEFKKTKKVFIHTDQQEFYCIGVTQDVRKVAKHLADFMSKEENVLPADLKAVWVTSCIPELKLNEKDLNFQGHQNLNQLPFDLVEGIQNSDEKEKSTIKMIKKKPLQDDKYISETKRLLIDKKDNTSNKDMNPSKRMKGMKKQAIQRDISRPRPLNLKQLPFDLRNEKEKSTNKMIEKKPLQDDKSISGSEVTKLLFDKEDNTSNKDMNPSKRMKGMKKQAIQRDISRPQKGGLENSFKALKAKLSKEKGQNEGTSIEMPVQKTSQAYPKRNFNKNKSELIFVGKMFQLMFSTGKQIEQLIKETGVLSLTFEKQDLDIYGEPEKIRECKKQLQRLCNETEFISFSQLHQEAVFDRQGLLHHSLEVQFDVTIKCLSQGDLIIHGTQENRRGVLEELRNIFEDCKNRRKIHQKAYVEDGKPAFPYLKFCESQGDKQDHKQVPMQSPEVQIKSLFGNSNTKDLQMDVRESQPASLQMPQESTGLEAKHSLEIKTTDFLKADRKTDKKNKRPDTVPKAMNLKPRPPVVTIMGHVDHGKTTLLDALRKSNVVAQEFGGITQHIGAFQVKLKSGHSITFLDTPGHAAFHNMRSRGASVTDIVVLVVAAEDGIMNQTLESIKHAKRAKVPVIVAINKIDHPNAKPDKIKYELSNHGLMAEEFGGDVQVIPISALKRINLDELQENIVVQSELLELRADNKCDVKGSVIESKIDIRRGKQVTTLIQSGTLKKGDLLIAGSSSAKVRMMFDENGKFVKEATPGIPVVVTGWDSLPSAGELVSQIKTEVELKQLLAERERQLKEELMDSSTSLIEDRRGKLLEETLKRKELKKSLYWKDYKKIMYTRKGDVTEEGLPKFPLIIKADVDGSLEVLLETLETFYSQHIELSIVSSGVGDITDGDLELAHSTGARIYGFNVKENSSSSKTLDVKLTLDNVIYDLFDNVVDDIKEVMPTYEEETEIGRGEVLELFKIKDNNLGTLSIAGCKCENGTFKRDSTFKIVRNEEVVYEGKILSMKRLKKDVSIVKEGNDCGLGVAIGIEIKEGDEVICIDKETKKIELEWEHGIKH